jgi:hypothetical protein
VFWLEVLNALAKAVEAARQRVIQTINRRLYKQIVTTGIFLEANARGYSLRNLSLVNLSELNRTFEKMREFGYESPFLETLEDMTAKAIFKEHAAN